MTGLIEQLKIPGMAKPGRRHGTPADVREAIIARTKAARESIHLSHAQIAAELSELTGRVILADSYRKWESESLIPHDLIVPFCNITRTDVYELLTGEPFRLGRVIQFPGRRVS